MLNSDVIMGQRVKCVYPLPLYLGLIGTITMVPNAPNNTYEVKYDNGYSAFWADASSHEIHIEYAMPLSPMQIQNVINAIKADDAEAALKIMRDPIAEAPCKVCSRPNDLGVKKCWNCECANPC